MTRTYQPKYLYPLIDNTPNPEYNPHTDRKRAYKPRPTKFARGEFVAWDGEGLTGEDGRHRYVILCSSAMPGDPLLDPSGISTRDALEFIATVGEQNRRAVHVVFGGGYDVNMILAELTHAQLEKIWAGKWVTVYRKFRICYRPRKSFTVKRFIPSLSYKDQPRQSVVLWDVWGFFQGTFVTACEKYLGKNAPELQFIAEQKQKRSTFDVADTTEIIRYCQAECMALVALMEKLRLHMQEAGLQISRWDGAGACAAALLKRENVKLHKAITPVEVRRAAQYAYAGGRMEVARYGHAPNTPVYHYDINSAYPTAMVGLPSLAGATWKRHTGFVANDHRFALYHVRWNFKTASMYPFFWRSHDSSIFFPQEGEGWYWTPELYAALAAKLSGALRGKIDVLESWVMTPATQGKPFAFLPPLYEQRRKWKRDGVGAEKVLKLAINSLYGKTAQHIGGRDGQPPSYHQLEWAGYITSFTRAMLYSAALPAITERALIMTATDGLYSLIPLPDLACGSGLGEWESHTHAGITVAQSGVYWTHESDGKASPFCRGFDRGSLSVKSVVAAWRRGETSLPATLTRFVSMGSALAGDNGWRKWRQWVTAPRVLSLSADGTKRVDTTDSHKWSRRYGPAARLVDTRASIPAAQIVGQRVSAPYPLPWEPTESRPESPVLDGVPLQIAEQEAFDSLI